MNEWLDILWVALIPTCIIWIGIAMDAQEVERDRFRRGVRDDD